MKKIYMLPTVDKIQCDNADVLTTSIYVDPDKRESVIKDHFAPLGAQVVFDRE